MTRTSGMMASAVVGTGVVALGLGSRTFVAPAAIAEVVEPAAPTGARFLGCNSAAAASGASWGVCGAVAAAGLCAAALRLALTRRTSSSSKKVGDTRVVRSSGVPETGLKQLVTDVSPMDGPNGTYQVGIDFKGWLQSAKEEINVSGLRVEGKLPAWLRGSLVHAGPAKFEFGEDEFVDWVDGQAMLYRVQFHGDGQCSYRNRWLDTWNHRSHREAGRIAVRETCSRPSLPNFWDRVVYMFQPPNNENGNLHISQFTGGSRSVSMSVGSQPLEFTLSEMETIGKVPFQDELTDLGPLIFHAEPHMDYETGEWFTCAIQLRISMEQMGLKPEYVVFSVTPDQPKEPGVPLKRRLIARIETEHPAPVHTIGLTSQYIVMIQIPYPMNWNGIMKAESQWLMTGKYEGNLNDYNTWQPERPTLIRLINKTTGEQKAVFEADPFFFFHIINCYEEKCPKSGNDMVYVDVVCYEEPPVGFPLKQARSGDVEDWRGGGGEVKRYALNLTTGECSSAGWPDNCFDEPKVNPKVDGSRHKFSWGVIDDHGMLRLTKQDHETHEVLKWTEQDVSRELPWQPVFVPEPYSDREDAGVVLSFVRDQPTGNTFCAVVDAADMHELARIHFPEGHHVPLHGHGTFLAGQF